MVSSGNFSKHGYWLILVLVLFLVCGCELEQNTFFKSLLPVTRDASKIGLDKLGWSRSTNDDLNVLEQQMFFDLLQVMPWSRYLKSMKKNRVRSWVETLLNCFDRGLNYWAFTCHHGQERGWRVYFFESNFRNVLLITSKYKHLKNFKHCRATWVWVRWPTVNRKDMNLSNFKNSNYRIRFCESVEFKTTWATETPGLVMGANMMRPSFRSGKYIPEKHFNLVWFNENSL